MQGSLLACHAEMCCDLIYDYSRIFWVNCLSLKQDYTLPGYHFIDLVPPGPGKLVALAKIEEIIHNSRHLHLLTLPYVSGCTESSVRIELVLCRNSS